MEGHEEIETERLLLRPVAPGDAAELFLVYSDPAAMRHWSDLPHRTVEETAAVIAKKVAGPATAWSIVTRADRQVVGLVFYLGNQGSPGMGYLLHRARWRQGIMTEAVRAALRYGFTRMGLDRVELWIGSENLASQRVAEHAGFQRRSSFLHKFPQDMRPHEKLVYGIYREDWERGAAPKRPFRALGIMPVLAVPDVAATLAHYRDVLGFAVDFTVGEPPLYAGVSLREWMATGASIRLSQAPGRAPVKEVKLHLEVGPDIADLYAIYRARGVAVEAELGPTPWGETQFCIRDCNGYQLEFSTPG
jgi:ribosomal-protein-alanine N-acetyltransferase